MKHPCLVPRALSLYSSCWHLKGAWILHAVLTTFIQLGCELSLGLPLTLESLLSTDPAVGKRLLKSNQVLTAFSFWPPPPIKFRYPQQRSTCSNFLMFLRDLVPPCFVWSQDWFVHLSKETVQVKSQLCSVLNADKLDSLHIFFQTGGRSGTTLAGGKLGGSWRSHSASRPDLL